MSRLTLRAFALLLTLVAATGAWRASAASGPIPYPEGWRQWTHLKSMAIVSDAHPLFAAFGGVHHVYVNRVGFAAARTGGTYPNGSVLVFDLRATALDGGAYAEGDRKFIGVMVKHSKRFAATGGWGFEAFAGDSKTERVVKDAKSECFDCHAAQAQRDYVFSAFRP